MFSRFSTYFPVPSPPSPPLEEIRLLPTLEPVQVLWFFSVHFLRFANPVTPSSAFASSPSSSSLWAQSLLKIPFYQNIQKEIYNLPRAPCVFRLDPCFVLPTARFLSGPQGCCMAPQPTFKDQIQIWKKQGQYRELFIEGECPLSCLLQENCFKDTCRS